MLAVACGIQAESRCRDIRADRVNGDQVCATVLGTIHTEGLDLSLVGDPLWTECVRVANSKADEAVPESPVLHWTRTIVPSPLSIARS